MASGTELRDFAEEFSVHQVSFHLAPGLALVVDHLPVSDGGLQSGRELLGVDAATEASDE